MAFPDVPRYNLARFDFVSIRLAVACARTGNLTEAARECNLVLPAASRRLRDLERALGGPLFERHSRGVTPTALGLAFMKRGMAILQELDNLLIELADARQGVVRHVHVCAGTAAITQFLPRCWPSTRNCARGSGGTRGAGLAAGRGHGA